MKLNKTIILLTFFLCIHNVSAFSPGSTHAGISQEVVDFYNLYYSGSISDTQKEWMIEGSIKEDEPASRAINHFYDPVNDKGIQGSRTAKEWATSGVLAENEYSWPKAIKYYAEGREQKAFVALGHVMHLLGDMVVPDHTRADEHTRGSVFESWASDNKNRDTLRGLGTKIYQSGNMPIEIGNISTYFDYLAKYSNENYFSQDTIQIKKYDFPVVENYDGDFAYSVDNLFGDKHVLFKKLDLREGSPLKYVYDIEEKDPTVVSDYFDRLSRQTILAQAGAIKLFLLEAEKARAEYLAEQKKKQDEAYRMEQEEAQRIEQANILGRIGIGFVINIGNIKKKVFAVTGNIADKFTSGALGLAQGAGNIFSMVDYTAKETADLMSDEMYRSIYNPLVLSEVDDGFRAVSEQHADVEIVRDSEGTGQSRGAETTLTEADIALLLAIIGKDNLLQKVAQDNNLKFIFVSGGGSSSSRTDDRQDDGLDDGQQEDDKGEEEKEEEKVEAPKLSIGSDTCRFSYVEGGCVIATSTVALSLWSSTTSVFEIFSGSDFSTTTASSTELVLGQGIHDISVVAVGQYNNRSATSTLTVEVNKSPIVINEIAWDGSTFASTDEWIELYNNTNHSIDLSDWRLYAQDGSPDIQLSGSVSSADYFLVERKTSKAKDELTESPVVDIPADLWISFNTGLENGGEEMTLEYSPSTESGKETFVSDHIPMCDNWCENGGSKSTMERFDSEISGEMLTLPDSNWGSNTGVARNGNSRDDTKYYGTPNTRNSRSYMPMNSTYLEGNVTLKKAKSPYIFHDNFYLGASTSKMIIEPGTVIKFCSSGNLSSDGVVEARGTASEPIVFTSITDDEYAGDTDSLGNCQSDRTVFSGGIDLFDVPAISIFENIIYRYSATPLSSYSSNLSIKNSTFEFGKGAMVFGATADIFDSSFLSLDSSFLDVYDSAGVRSNIDMRNLRVKDLKASRAGIFFDSDIKMNNVEIDGVSPGSGIWADNSSVIADGLTIKNISGDRAFSAYKRDIAIANSTFSNGPEYGLLLGGENMEITNTSVSGFNKGILHYEGVLEISDSNIFDNFEGITFEAYEPLLTIINSRIYGNLSYGILSNSGSDENVVSAKGNYWGDESGPYHEIQNPDGFGNTVSDYVDFLPFSSADYL